MKKRMLALALAVCLALCCCGCGAKEDADKHAGSLPGAAQNDCYAEFDRRIPALEYVIPDAVRTEQDGSDENGTYHSYEYAWNDPDTTALSDRFVSWLELLDETDGVRAEPYLNGTYFIVVDEERVGIAGTSRNEGDVRIYVRFYTNDAS